MYAAISGLKSHMSKLNVIGNNIANVNTYGYKTARMTFRESMYTTLISGTDGGNLTGGINPSQVAILVVNFVSFIISQFHLCHLGLF